jgi:hydroxymethylpyrimidine/phosphomethylpyrimidine kinase
LSSAIAAQLALGSDLEEAVQLAREYVRGALQAGAGVRTGAGSGPLDHSYAPLPMRLLPVR